MPDNVNLTFALGLTPNDIIDYFNSKGYAFSFDWRDVWQNEHTKAFTVAKVMDLDILQDIRSMIDKVNKGEMSEMHFYLNLENYLKAKGWWGKQEVINPDTGEREIVQLGSPWRLKRILETNLVVANSAGRYKVQKENANFAKYWRYRDQDDHRVRPIHRAIGNIFETAVLIHSHPFWNKWYPPNAWGCRCFVENYTAREVQQRGFKILTSEEFNVLLAAALSPFGVSAPEEGWAYNPGASAWKPDLTKYPDELIEGVGLKL